MKFYEAPTLVLLTLENEDILTVSDPAMDDREWEEI